MRPVLPVPPTRLAAVLLAAALVGACGERWLPWPSSSPRIAQRVQIIAPPEPSASAASSPAAGGPDAGASGSAGAPPAPAASAPMAAASSAPSASAPAVAAVASAAAPTPAPRAANPPSVTTDANASGTASVPGVLYFDSDAYRVRPGDLAIVAAHARRLQASPALHLTLRAYTDRQGPPDYNLALARKRADTVRKLLIARGARAQQIEVVSVGEGRRARASRDTAADRRVEFVYR